MHKESSNTQDWDTAINRAVIATAALGIPEDEGLEEVRARIARLSTSDIETARHSNQPRRPSLWSAAQAWVARLLPAPARPVFAVMAVALLIQGLVISNLWQEQENYAEFRNAYAEPSASQTFVRVLFRPELREQEMRQLLRQNSAEIVAGPSQWGEYYLLINSHPAAAARDALRLSTQVEKAEIVQRLPTQEH